MGGQRSEVRLCRRCSRLCDHVLLTFVEPDLAERDGAHRHVDGGGDEAVDADLVVQSVDVLRRIFIVTDVLLGERHVFDQHGRLRAEEDSQHRQHDDAPDADHDPARGHLRPAEQERRHVCVRTDRSIRN